MYYISQSTILMIEQGEYVKVVERWEHVKETTGQGGVTSFISLKKVTT